MATLFISQASSSGVTLLAAHVRYWMESMGARQVYVLCDAKWTLARDFWDTTVPWLLGESSGSGAPPVRRVVRTGQAYALEEVEGCRELPAQATGSAGSEPWFVVLLRIPRDTRTPQARWECERKLGHLVTRFGPMNVLELQDESGLNYAPVHGLQAIVLRNARILAPAGAPAAPVLALAHLSAACLYAAEEEAFFLWREALAMVTAVYGCIPTILARLLNEGVTSCRSGFPVSYDPRDWIREGDAILFPVDLEPLQVQALSACSSDWRFFLEHIAQTALQKQPEQVHWGVAYTHVAVDEVWVVVVARYDRAAMSQTLRDRLKKSPTAASYRFPLAERSHYGKAKLAPREFREMLTAVLPAFFATLDDSLRRHGLLEAHRELAAEALRALDPASRLVDQGDGSAVSLDHGTTWTCGGNLSATHPAVLAACCLLGPTAKADRIRRFYEERKRLRICKGWHDLKAHSPSTSYPVKSFCAQYIELWTCARLPLSQDEFSYDGQGQEWQDLRDVYDTAGVVVAGGMAGQEFYAKVKSLFEWDGQTRWGHRHFFSLKTTLGLYRKAKATDCRAGWCLGGFWEPPTSGVTSGTGRVCPKPSDAVGDCLMWSPEVVQHLLDPVWQELVQEKHVPGPGFLCIGLSRSRDGHWVELRLLTSGPGAAKDSLQSALAGGVEHEGLSFAADVTSGYGGSVLYRCQDAWWECVHPGRQLRRDGGSRACTMAVCVLGGVQDVEAAVAGNRHLRRVAVDARPDLVIALAGSEELASLGHNPGWQAPRIIISEGDSAPHDIDSISLELDEAVKLVAGLVGFEIVYRFPALSPPVTSPEVCDPDDEPHAIHDGREAPGTRVASLQSTGGLGERQPVALLVNDDQEQLKRWVCDVRGYEVLTASTPEEALACHASRGDEIGLVITDNYMPHENQGLELARRLRESGYSGPIVVATGAPTGVAETVRVGLCLSVTEANCTMGTDNLRAWSAIRATDECMCACQEKLSLDHRRQLLQDCRYGNMVRLMGVVGDDLTQGLFGEKADEVARSFGVSRLGLEGLDKLRPLYDSLREVKSAAAAERDEKVAGCAKVWAGLLRE